jgi:DNA-binding YbaB/EbfC family protein
MFDVNKLMKQAQKIQADMSNIQNELESMTVTGAAGGGAVQIVCSGKYQFKSVKFGESAPLTDKAMMEDLVLTALNDVAKQIAALAEDKMKGITQGINIPGLNLPGF